MRSRWHIVPRVKTRGYTLLSLWDSDLRPGGTDVCSHGFQPVVRGQRLASIALVTLLLLAACAQPAAEIETPTEPRPPSRDPLPGRPRHRHHRRRHHLRGHGRSTIRPTRSSSPSPAPRSSASASSTSAARSRGRRTDGGSRSDGTSCAPTSWAPTSCTPVDRDLPAEASAEGSEEGAEEGAEEAGDESAEAELQSVQTSEIFVEVQSVLPEGGEVTDIRGLKPLRQ